MNLTTWPVRNAKLHLSLNPDIPMKFNADLTGNVTKAAKNWPDLVKTHAQ